MLLLALSSAGVPVWAAGPAPRLVLAAEDDAAPWSKPDGTGYVNELVRTVFAEAGWALELKVMPYARCKAEAAAGRVAGCFSASRTPELIQQFLYPQTPVFSARNLVVVRGDSPWTSCEPPRLGRPPVVGLVRGYEYVPALDTLLARHGARPELAGSEAGNLRKLRAGRVDAAVVTVDEVKTLASLRQLASLPDTLRTACDLGTMPAYVVFSRAHPQGEAARAAYDATVPRLQQSGAIAEMQARWRRATLPAGAVTNSAGPHER